MLITKDVKYKGIVEDHYYPDTSHDGEHGGFDTPEEALKWAKDLANDSGFTGVNYWVEYDVSLEVADFWGVT